jgi:hypothetical protein
VKVKVERSYPLAQAARAHEDLQSRRTSGSAFYSRNRRYFMAQRALALPGPCG